MARRRGVQRDLTNDPLTQSKLDPTTTPEPTPKRRRAMKRPLKAQINVGQTGLGEGGHLDDNIPLGALGNLANIRADRQSGVKQLGNMLGQIVVGEIIGGTIESAGYLGDLQGAADVITGKEDEWGNTITKFGQGIREWSQEEMPIYQRDDLGGFNPSDSGWWFGNGVSIASSLSMMLPTMGAAKALGFGAKTLSKGLRALTKGADIAAQMGKKQKWMTRGVTQAVLSRQTENMLEAHGTFKEKYDQYQAEGMGEKEARSLAAEAASMNYKAGWAMLLQDIPQYLLIGKVFNPMSGKVESAMAKMAKSGTKPGFVNKAAKRAMAYSSEGFEEMYQFIAAEESKFYSDKKAGLVDDKSFNERMADYATDGEMWTSFVFGMAGGAVFQGVGPNAQKLFETKQDRENNRNFQKTQEDFIKGRGMEMAAKNAMVAQADQTGDENKMREARVAVNLSNTAEALAMNSFEQHVENLNSFKDITNEELNEYAEQGIELNRDMLNELVPQMVEESLQMRDEFYKIVNKNVDPGIAASVAYNKHYVNKFKAKSAEYKSYVAKALEFPGASTRAREIAKSKVNIQALKAANGYLQAEYNDNKSESIKAQITANAKEIEKESKNIEEQKASNKGVQRTAEEIKADKRIDNEIASDPSIVDKLAGSILADARVDDYLAENAYKLSPAYQKKFKEDKALRALSSIKDVKIAEKELESVNDQIAAGKDDPTLQDKKDILEKKVAQLKSIEEAEAKKKAQEEIIKDNATKKSVDSDSHVPKVEPDPSIVENAEDDNRDFEEDPTESVTKAQDNALDVKTQAGRSIRVMDQAPQATPQFIDYMNNGIDKTGDPVEYVLAPYDEASAAMIKEFEKFRDGDQSDKEALQNFYINLPLKAMYKGNPNITSGIHAGGEGFTESFMEQEYPERKAIIDILLANDRAVTTVDYQYGGRLVNDKLPAGEDSEFNSEYARNNPLDLLQFKGKNITEKDLEVYISDQDGDLLNANNKKKDVMRMKMTSKELASDKKPQPYAGGIFLRVKKTNGDDFPLKLNTAKLNSEEAATVADILLDTTVHKKYALKTTIADLKITHPEIVARWNKEHPAEMKFITKDGTAAELMNLFVYTSNKTQKFRPTRLFPSGNRVNAGNLEVKKENAVEGREGIINFLMTKKNRQFNVKLWSKENPKSTEYRKYMLDSGNLYTEGVVDRPLFSKDNGGNTSIYNKSVSGEIIRNTPSKPGADLMISESELPGAPAVTEAIDPTGLATPVETAQPQAFDEDGMPNMDLIEKSFGAMPVEPKVEETDGVESIVPAKGSVELNYTPQGAKAKKVNVSKEDGRYVIRNEKGVEIYAKDSVDRNKVMAKYGVAKQGARIVQSNGKPWVVWPNGRIFSGISNKFMKWGPEHGKFKEFMEKAKFPPIPVPVSEKNVVDLETEVADKVIKPGADLMLSPEDLMPTEIDTQMTEQKNADQATELLSDKLLDDIQIDDTAGDLFDETCDT